MAGPSHAVSQLYTGVIKDVVTNVKEAFLDEGVDESVLHELKKLWEMKAQATGAVDLFGLGPVANAAVSTSKRVRAEAAQKSVPKAYPGGPAQGVPVVRPLTPGLMPATGASLTDAARAAHMALPQLAQNVLQGQHLLTPGGSRFITVQQPSQGSVIQFGASGAITGSPIVVIPRTEQQQVASQSVIAKQLKQEPGVLQVDGPGCSSQHKLYNQEQGAVEMLFEQQEVLDNQPGTSQDASLHRQNVEARKSLRKKKRPYRVMKNDKVVIQVDGPPGGGVSDDEDEDLDDSDPNDEDNDEDNEDEEGDGVGPVEEGEPLNSDDDPSDDDDAEVMFDADNVAVCQYDKVQRSRNKWKFVLKDGIMNLHGKDYVFSKATGEAEW